MRPQNGPPPVSNPPPPRPVAAAAPSTGIKPNGQKTEEPKPNGNLKEPVKAVVPPPPAPPPVKPMAPAPGPPVGSKEPVKAVVPPPLPPRPSASTGNKPNASKSVELKPPVKPAAAPPPPPRPAAPPPPGPRLGASKSEDPKKPNGNSKEPIKTIVPQVGPPALPPPRPAAQVSTGIKPSATKSEEPKPNGNSKEPVKAVVPPPPAPPPVKPMAHAPVTPAVHKPNASKSVELKPLVKPAAAPPPTPRPAAPPPPGPRLGASKSEEPKPNGNSKEPIKTVVPQVGPPALPPPRPAAQVSTGIKPSATKSEEPKPNGNSKEPVKAVVPPTPTPVKPMTPASVTPAVNKPNASKSVELKPLVKPAAAPPPPPRPAAPPPPGPRLGASKSEDTKKSNGNSKEPVKSTAPAPHPPRPAALSSMGIKPSASKSDESKPPVKPTVSAPPPPRPTTPPPPRPMSPPPPGSRLGASKSQGPEPNFFHSQMAPPSTGTISAAKDFAEQLLALCEKSSKEPLPRGLRKYEIYTPRIHPTPKFWRIDFGAPVGTRIGLKDEKKDDVEEYIPAYRVELPGIPRRYIVCDAELGAEEKLRLIWQQDVRKAVLLRDDWTHENRTYGRYKLMFKEKSELWERDFIVHGKNEDKHPVDMMSPTLEKYAEDLCMIYGGVFKADRPILLIVDTPATAALVIIYDYVRTMIENGMKLKLEDVLALMKSKEVAWDENVLFQSLLSVLVFLERRYSEVRMEGTTEKIKKIGKEQWNAILGGYLYEYQMRIEE